jgi:pyruvate ferredoxin oxidoreductase delta subunit
MSEKYYEDLPIGGTITTPGSAMENNTGTWRTFKPIWDSKKCIHCMTCFIYCPDSAIPVKDGKRLDFDYDHCKGCGICAKECPPKTHAITMERG